MPYYYIFNNLKPTISSTNLLRIIILIILILTSIRTLIIFINKAVTTYEHLGARYSSIQINTI